MVVRGTDRVVSAVGEGKPGLYLDLKGILAWFRYTLT